MEQAPLSQKQMLYFSEFGELLVRRRLEPAPNELRQTMGSLDVLSKGLWMCCQMVFGCVVKGSLDVRPCFLFLWNPATPKKLNFEQ
jgi:hypothetical protein